MESRSRLASDFRFLFKAIPNVRNGGCHVNIWLPEGATRSSEPLPLAMMSHGGGWIIGAADSIPYNQVRYFHKHGIAVASFEYRHIPNVHMKGIREDLLDAYHYVQTGLNADLREAGSSATIDGTRCSFMGWSAGGANTLWIASDVVKYRQTHGKESLPPLRAIISSYPVSKFDNFKATRADWEILLQGNSEVDAAWKEMLSGPCNTAFKMEVVQSNATKDRASSGNGEEQAAEMAARAKDLDPQASKQVTGSRGIVGGALIGSGALPSVLLDHDAPFPDGASPISLLSSDFPPTCILVASEDKLLPIDHSVDVYNGLRDLKVDTLLVTCNGMEHGEAECLPGNNWMDSWWEEAIKPSLDFTIKRMKT